METNPPRGMTDTPPEEKLFKDVLLSILKEQFERYGFNPIETPILERFDVLSSKFTGGEEILKETFKVKDQGGRDLGLRYDLTVPLARFVAANPNLKLPFKRYAIGTVYRDGPIKLGRYREFYQCDCDIVGADTAAADAQCVQLALSVFEALGEDFTIKVNSIALLKEMLRQEGVPEDKLTGAILSLDKYKKIGKEGVEEELKEKSIKPEPLQAVMEVASKGTNDEKVAAIRSRFGDTSALQRISEILTLAPDARVSFDPSLARGLAYYTGVVFEVYLLNSEITSSVAAGGRYDTMIGSLLGRPDDFPAVGISFGLAPIMDALKKGEQQLRKTVTNVFIIPIKTRPESMALAEELRRSGINADIDILGRGISKCLDYANALDIPAVVFVGQRELDEGKFKLKDMRSGEEKLLTRAELIVSLREQFGVGPR